MQLRTMKSLAGTGVAIAECMLLLFIALAGRDALAADRKIIWEGREQFVALERQDPNPNGPAPANDHPADVSLERLTAFLGALDLRPGEKEKPEPLFTRESLEIVSPQLREGLLKASPGEDVTFAVIGLYKSLFGFAKSPKVTTGRLFYRQGRINLIVGLAQNDVNEREDRRLHPFTPGSRQSPAEGDWALLPHDGHSGIILTRRDWAVSAEAGETPAVTPSPAANPVAPAQPAVSVTRPDNARNPAERLTILEDLKRKGLITEEEYRGKRREILEGL